MKKQTILPASALVCAAALVLLFFAFGRKSVGKASGAETAFLTKSQSAPAAPKTAEEVQREKDEALVRSVISKMSVRARETIVIDDYGEFIADLKAVLEEDAQNSKDDLSLLTLVDKTHPLPDGYAPARLIPLVKNDAFNIIRNDLSLRPEAYEALVVMGREAKKDGITLLVSSTYRSYEYQKKYSSAGLRSTDLRKPREKVLERARASTRRVSSSTSVPSTIPSQTPARARG